MTKRLLSIFTSLMLLISIFAAVPVQANSAGEWVADFKAAADGATSILGNVGSGNNYIRKTSSWDYSSDGDYVTMKGNEGSIILNAPTSSDYTIGFKIQMGTAGGGFNTVPRLLAKDSNGRSIDISTLNGNVFWIYPKDKYIKLHDYNLGDEAVTEKTFYFSNDEWVDVKFVFDVDDTNENDSLFATLYIYLNGVKSSAVQIPSTRTLNSATCYLPESSFKSESFTGTVDILGISRLILKGGTDTLLKDVYAHDGISFDSEIEKSSVFGEYRFEELMTNMSECWTQDATGTVEPKIRNIVSGKTQYDKASSTTRGLYANIKVKAGVSSADNAPYFEYNGTQETGGQFVYSVKVYFNNFNLPYKLAEFYSRGLDSNGTATHSSLLETTATKGDTAKLNLSYVDINGEPRTIPYDIKLSSTSKGGYGWHTIRVVADYNGEYPVFTVNVSNNNGTLIDDVTFTDYKAKCNGTKMNFKLSIGITGDDLLNLPVDSTLSIDDLYIAKLEAINKITVEDVKLYQGQNIIKVSETFDKTKELKVAPTVSNNSNTPLNGTLIVAQYGAGNELINMAIASYSANAAQNFYTADFKPGIASPSVIFIPDENVSYIKLFVMDNTENITPYTKSAMINAQ